jgi:alpha-tubulin suppressor-like RCC1 family protein
VVAIAEADLWSLALESDGTVWAWGQDNLGQLGSGSGANSPVPVQVSGLETFSVLLTSVASGLAVISQGTGTGTVQNDD